MSTSDGYVPGRADRDYIESIGRAPHPALLAIERAAEPDDIPILDRAGGRVLATLAVNRSRIVEVGTAYGYSTLWMALAQPAGGTIVTFDPDRARTDRARGWWREAGIPEPNWDFLLGPWDADELIFRAFKLFTSQAERSSEATSAKVRESRREAKRWSGKN